MSGLARRLLAGRSATTVTGALYGSGSLSIPAGVTSITLTGNGGPGKASTNYYGWTLTLVNNPFNGSNAVGSAHFYFSGPATPSATSSGFEYQLPSSFVFEVFGNAVTPNATATQQSPGSPTYNWITYDQSTSSYLSYSWQYKYNQPAAGSATTASIQSQNITFAGAATGVTTAPSPTVQTFSGLSGFASSMTYNVPAGGSLSYSYTY